MITFEKILCPVDLSPESRAIAGSVKAMASRFGSEIIVMNVVELPQTWFGSPEAASWRALINGDRLRESAKIALDRFIAQEFSGVRVTSALAEGDAAWQIVEYAKDDPASLIMMATHGYKPFRALLLGSVTAKVLHDTQCPVWTGVHAEETAAHSPERWKRMLCAIDTEPKDLAVLKWAAQFAAEQRLSLRLVHAVPGTQDTVSEESAPGLYRFLFEAAREQLAKMQREAGTSFEVCLLGGQAGRVVHTSAVGHDADLIVIGRGVMQASLGRLRSRAYSIIREAPCPVISI